MKITERKMLRRKKQLSVDVCVGVGVAEVECVENTSKKTFVRLDSGEVWSMPPDTAILEP